MAISPCCCCLFLLLIHGFMLQTCEANRKLSLMAQPLAVNVIISTRIGKAIPARPPSPKLNGSERMLAPPGPPPRAPPS
ncbi:hypothetical protein V6N13_014779 [Hibiscus sabdariffa]